MSKERNDVGALQVIVVKRRKNKGFASSKETERVETKSTI